MHTSLAIQSTYEQIEIGLFINDHQKEIIREDKRTASKTIITHIDTLLKKNNIKLTELSFIAINQGPAPFTSLRVVIATANGLSFASKIPLVGVDGLMTFMNEQHDNAWPHTVTLFNAFNNDVYFGIESPGQEPQTGCAPIEQALATIHQEMPTASIRFIGNGAPLFRTTITETFSDQAHIPDLPYYPSLESINARAQQQWLLGHTANLLLPLYLKHLHYKSSINQ